MFRRNSQKDSNINDNAWNIKDVYDIFSWRARSSNDYSVYIDESIPCNKTHMRESIEVQLKVVIEEKLDYLHKVSIKPLYLINDFISSDNTYNCIISKSGNVNELKPVIVKLTIIIGHLRLFVWLKFQMWTASTKTYWRKSVSNRNDKVFKFSGARISHKLSNCLARHQGKTRVFNFTYWNKPGYQHFEVATAKLH